MDDAHMTKDNWVALFCDVGVDETTMRRWHTAFERRWPREHHAFLGWLGLSETEIDGLRQRSRAT
jgi:hypothetical protein